jgi:glycosyltransferase involved in cell wall biosynthesis
MKIVVNALPITNLSGRHVVLGMLRHLAAWGGTRIDYTVLYHHLNKDIRHDWGPHVTWRKCPDFTARWPGRTAWECAALPPLLIHEGADLLFMTSGTALPVSPVPQISLAMNPWCFVHMVHRTRGERIKASLQRLAYRHSVGRANTMVYLSRYLQDAYHGDAGRSAKRSLVMYAGIQKDVWEAARNLGDIIRVPHRIVCVSVMAPHKGVETLIAALSLLRSGYRVPASLALVGGWPDPSYERRIRLVVAAHNLERYVFFEGYVTRETLLQECARAQVFALFSRCESFGIPGLEAQALHTPVVCSNVGALPEVYGAGGLYRDVDDPAGAAETLAALLSDQSIWKKYSQAARLNAAHFREEDVYAPLQTLLGSFLERPTHR